MNEVRVHIEKPGMYSTIQDGGRRGYRSSGVPVSGPLDQRSASIANWLVGNAPNAPLLEITLLGPKIRIEGTVAIAFTGASIKPYVDGNPVPLYETICITGDNTISFGTPPQNGCRLYLAIGGEWQIMTWLNSASALSQLASAFIPESVLKAGQVIHVNAGGCTDRRVCPTHLRLKIPSQVILRVLKGPELRDDDELMRQFQSATFTISQDSNRMGYRLLPHLENHSLEEMISSGTVPGTIQMTKAGQPLMLMKDGQTTGGYPRIANIISADLDLAGQLKPGDNVQFRFIEIADAVQALRQYRSEELTIANE